MRVKEFIRFVAEPGFIVGVLVRNIGITLPTVSCGETALIISMIAAFTGYIAYRYEAERMERMAEVKARALAETDRLGKEYEERCRWEEILSWRDEITGRGIGGNTKKVVSPWQES